MTSTLEGGRGSRKSRQSKIGCTSFEEQISVECKQGREGSNDLKILWRFYMDAPQKAIQYQERLLADQTLKCQLKNDELISPLQTCKVGSIKWHTQQMLWCMKSITRRGKYFVRLECFPITRSLPKSTCGGLFGGGGFFQIQRYWLMSQQLTGPSGRVSFFGRQNWTLLEDYMSICFNFVRWLWTSNWIWWEDYEHPI